MPARLTKPQMARLIDIGNRKWPSYGASPATMKKLEELGCIRPQGGKIAKTGRTIWHADGVLTDVGIRVLAGLPGDEFDRFRAALSQLGAKTGEGEK